MNLKTLFTGGLLSATLILSAAALADGKPVGISKTLQSVTTHHKGEAVEIKRNQDNAATISPYFEKTSRPCPPFCIQPIEVSPGVKTVGELELLEHVQQKDVLLIDSRTPDWIDGKSGTIPGAVNIPWTQVSIAKGADEITLSEHMEFFGATQRADDSWDFSKARTLLLFCNGYWCGQSPVNIKTLLDMGYPADKLLWYRGGMQAWTSLGFNTVAGSNTKESYLQHNYQP